MLDITSKQLDYKMQLLSVKCLKYMADSEMQKRAAEERADASKEHMQEKEHQREQGREEHEREMMRLKIELARAEAASRQGHPGHGGSGIASRQTAPQAQVFNPNFGMNSDSNLFGHATMSSAAATHDLNSVGNQDFLSQTNNQFLT